MEAVVDGVPYCTTPIGSLTNNSRYVWTTNITDDVSVFDFTDNGQVVDEWINATYTANAENMLHLLIGFDTLLVPGSIKIDVVQLFVDNRCLIFKPTVHSQLIKSFFSNKHNKFVGVNMKVKLARLQYQYGIGGEAQHVDLGCSLGRDLVISLYDKTLKKMFEIKNLNARVHSTCLDVVIFWDIGGKYIPPELKAESINIGRRPIFKLFGTPIFKPSDYPIEDALNPGRGDVSCPEK